MKHIDVLFQVIYVGMWRISSKAATLLPSHLSLFKCVLITSFGVETFVGYV